MTPPKDPPTIATDTRHLTLLPHHRARLRASGLSDEIIVQRGYKSAAHSADLLALGFSQAQSRYVPALLVPSYDIHHGIHWQMRPDQTPPGHAKYMTPAGGDYCIDVSPAIRDQALDPTIPLGITEGVIKADAGNGAGLCYLAISGVWLWQKK